MELYDRALTIATLLLALSVTVSRCSPIDVASTTEAPEADDVLASNASAAIVASNSSDVDANATVAKAEAKGLNATLLDDDAMGRDARNSELGADVVGEEVALQSPTPTSIVSAIEEEGEEGEPIKPGEEPFQPELAIRHDDPDSGAHKPSDEELDAILKGLTIEPALNDTDVVAPPPTPKASLPLVEEGENDDNNSTTTTTTEPQPLRHETRGDESDTGSLVEDAPILNGSAPVLGDEDKNLDATLDNVDELGENVETETKAHPTESDQDPAVAPLSEGDEEHSAVPLADNAEWWKPLNLSFLDEMDITNPPTPSVLTVVPSKKLISFQTEAHDTWKEYVDEINEFLKPYETSRQSNNVQCSWQNRPSTNQACLFDLRVLGPSCTKENNYGYSVGKPCVFVAPAQVHDWVPLPFANDSKEVPDEVHRLTRIFNENFLFVTCDAGNDASRSVLGPMAWLPPYQGFPSYYFPYPEVGNNTYVSPLLAFEFLNPGNGAILQMTCTAWAQNIRDVPHRVAFRKFYLKVN